VKVTGSTYDTKDIAAARQAIGGEAGKFGSVGDGIPASVSAAMFGTLANSAAVAQAASALCSSMRTEYAKAETLVGAIERALDANVTNHAGTEVGNKKTFTAQQV
jgi:hypothetical protein